MIGGLNGAGMGFDELANNRQAEPCSPVENLLVFMFLSEPVKNIFYFTSFDPNACITNKKCNFISY